MLIAVRDFADDLLDRRATREPPRERVGVIGLPLENLAMDFSDYGSGARGARLLSCRRGGRNDQYCD